MMAKLAWIALAGALGTLARYGLSGLAQRWAGAAGSGFPWGTWAVNAVGCFLFGLLWAVCESRLTLSPHIRMAVFVGFLGALTTFSTFAFETVQFVRDAQWGVAMANVLVHNVVGVSLVLLGMGLGRTL